MESNPNLKENIISLAERLIARGEAHGEMRGKVRLLEQLLGRPSQSDEALRTMTLEELQQRFSALDLEYATRFKQS